MQARAHAGTVCCLWRMRLPGALLRAEAPAAGLHWRRAAGGWGGGSWATLLGPQTQEPGSPLRQGGAQEMLASLDLKPCYPLLLPCLSFLCLPSDYCRLPVEGVPGKIIGNCYT